VKPFTRKKPSAKRQYLRIQAVQVHAFWKHLSSQKWHLEELLKFCIDHIFDMFNVFGIHIRGFGKHIKNSYFHSAASSSSTATCGHASCPCRETGRHWGNHFGHDSSWQN
jgi:hypothetical protein